MSGNSTLSLSEIVAKLFSNPGGKIKAIVRTLFKIEIYLIIIAFVFDLIGSFIYLCYANLTFVELLFSAFLALIVNTILFIIASAISLAFSYLSYIIIYGFGELVEMVTLGALFASSSNTQVTDEPAHESTEATPECNTKKQDNDAPPSEKEAIEKWNFGVSKQGQNIGQCGLCGKKRQTLLLVSFEDFFGKSSKNICFNCFSKRNCELFKEDPHVWTCKECGSKNPSSLASCRDCGAYK